MKEFDQERWFELLDELGVTRETSTFQQLSTVHAESSRTYHNRDHVVDCLQQFDSARELATLPEEVECAIWFHDAGYDVHAADNEQQSADWAARFLRTAGVDEATVGRVIANIMATRHSESPRSGDEELIVDVDLSILGRAPADYDVYEANIRREYDWVPEDTFRTRRAEILQSFLNRPRIYTTDRFHDLFEEPARENLTRAIADLAAG